VHRCEAGSEGQTTDGGKRALSSHSSASASALLVGLPHSCHVSVSQSVSVLISLALGLSLALFPSVFVYDLAVWSSSMSCKAISLCLWSVSSHKHTQGH
jgi:hypothetical protein